MLKSELVDAIYEDNRRRLPRKLVRRAVDTVFDDITGTLAQGGRVELRGFGAFTVTEYKARKGRNPRTGEALEVPAKLYPSFRTSKLMTRQLNGQASE